MFTNHPSPTVPSRGGSVRVPEASDPPTVGTRRQSIHSVLDTTLPPDGRLGAPHSTAGESPTAAASHPPGPVGLGCWAWLSPCPIECVADLVRFELRRQLPDNHRILLRAVGADPFAIRGMDIRRIVTVQPCLAARALETVVVRLVRMVQRVAGLVLGGAEFPIVVRHGYRLPCEGFQTAAPDHAAITTPRTPCARTGRPFRSPSPASAMTPVTPTAFTTACLTAPCPRNGFASRPPRATACCVVT